MLAFGFKLLGGLGLARPDRMKQSPRAFIIVSGSSGGFHHSLAQIAPEEAGAGDEDVLGENIQAAAVSASHDPQGLRSEGAEASVHCPGSDICHCDGRMFHTSVGE